MKTTHGRIINMSAPTSIRPRDTMQEIYGKQYALRYSTTDRYLKWKQYMEKHCISSAILEEKLLVRLALS